MLEVGSGTGEHAICFAKALPELDLATERSRRDFARQHRGVDRDRQSSPMCVHPVAIDVREAVWGVEDDAPFDAMISLNMVHIAPWEAALGLVAGAGSSPETRRGPLVLRALHARAGLTRRRRTPPSTQISRGGTRAGACATSTISSVEAAPHGLELREVVAMLANNLSLDLC